MDQEVPIDNWGVVRLFSTAVKKESWIEAVSLGYTLLELGLRHLMMSKAGPTGEPIPSERIDNCRYLLDLAALARDEGFLPESLFRRIEAFNEARRKAIHKLLTGTVKLSELAAAASDVTPIYADTQRLWLKITIGPERRVGQSGV